MVQLHSDWLNAQLLIFVDYIGWIWRRRSVAVASIFFE
jgi:hypothetical protein